MVARRDLAGERRIINEFAKLNLRRGWTAALSRIRTKKNTSSCLISPRYVGQNESDWTIYLSFYSGGKLNNHHDCSKAKKQITGGGD